jgi:hypothetical protein
MSFALPASLTRLLNKPAVLLTDMTPGIYFNLSDDDYFGGTALGSTDLKTLCREPANWWYGSHLNPSKVDKAKPHFDFGKALHALVLEGEEAFDKLVAISPFDDFRKKVAQEWRDEQIAAGKGILDSDEVEVIRHMAALIHNHPEFNSLPTKKWAKEVAVFWEQDGILMRAKFDALKPGIGLDLKSYGAHNAQGRDPFDTAMRIIANQSYDVQRAHYARAYEELIKHVHERRYFEASNEEVAFLHEIAKAPNFAWVWMFYQKMDHTKGHAPVVMPIGSEPNDVSHRSGLAKIKTAIANYKGYMAKDGPNQPWAQINSLRWVLDHEFLPWMADVPNPQFTESKGA